MAAPRCKPVCSAEGRTCRRVCVFAGMLHACRAVCWGTPGACTPYALLCRGVRSARATRLAAATSNHTLALYPQGTDCFCHRRRRGGAGSGRWVCGWCSRRDEGGGRQWQARGEYGPWPPSTRPRSRIQRCFSAGGTPGGWAQGGPGSEHAFSLSARESRLASRMDPGSWIHTCM